MKKDKSYLSFMLCNEHFAVSVKQVMEVLQKQEVTIVPNTPDYILGVINFRGEIIPVVEIRKKLKMEERDVIDKPVTIILELQNGDITTKAGAVVDSVKDVLSIPPGKIREVPELGTEFDSEYLKGMYKSKNNFIMLIDFDKILIGTEVAQLAEI